MVIHTIGGREYDFGVEDVEERMSKVEPARITKTTFTARILGANYPVKQVVCVLTGLHSGDFLTLEACLALDRLGYKMRLSRHKPW